MTEYRMDLQILQGIFNTLDSSWTDSDMEMFREDRNENEERKRKGIARCLLFSQYLRQPGV